MLTLPSSRKPSNKSSGAGRRSSSGHAAPGRNRPRQLKIHVGLLPALLARDRSSGGRPTGNRDDPFAHGEATEARRRRRRDRYSPSRITQGERLVMASAASAPARRGEVRSCLRRPSISAAPRGRPSRVQRPVAAGGSGADLCAPRAHGLLAHGSYEHLHVLRVSVPACDAPDRHDVEVGAELERERGKHEARFARRSGPELDPRRGVRHLGDLAGLARRTGRIRAGRGPPLRSQA